MNPEELSDNKNDDSVIHNILMNLGLIIFVILAIVYLVLSSKYSSDGAFHFGKVFGIGLWFVLPWLFLKRKKVENAVNFSSILPIIGIAAAISLLITNSDGESHSVNEINSFKKGLSSIDEKFAHLQDSSDKIQRYKYYDEVNNYIDSYLRKSNSKSREIINGIKIRRNEVTNSQEKWFASKIKLDDMIANIVSEGQLSFSDQDLENINLFINSSGKIIEILDNVQGKNELRQQYFLSKNVGLKLKKVAEIYISYINNEITEVKYKKLVEKALNKLLKSQEFFDNAILKKQ